MSRLRAASIAALAGFAVLTVELAAVRLFAPHFGDSAFVWTNVIGVMLLALAGGAWLGGRLAVAGGEEVRLRIVLLLGAALTALVPLLAGPLGRALVPEGLALEDAQRTLVTGSLAATLIVFAPPVVLAGAVTPLLVGALARTHDPARSSGLVAGYGTLGSLVGTFVTTHLLVPGVGSRMTIWCAALALAMAALFLRRRGGTLAGVAACLGLMAMPSGPLDPPEGPVQLRAEVESAYQFLQVLEHPATESSRARTTLRINEGLDSFHSVRVEGTPWTEGCYYDWFVPLPRALVGNARREPRILSLGGAAGTFDNLFRAVWPASSVHSVEIDPSVTALGRAWFGAFRGSDSVTAGLDARVFVDIIDRTYDLVLVDAYERQVYVPAHVASREFFERLRAITTEDGIVAVNCGGVRFDDAVLTAIAGTMATVFGDACAFRVPVSRNFVVIARKGRPFDPGALVAEDGDDATFRELVAQLADPLRWRHFGPATEPLVDDKPVLDALFERSGLRRDSEPVARATRGDLDPTTAGERAFEHARHGNHEAVLATIEQARDETPYLRFLAGDSEWALHEPRAARAEYRRALDLDATEELRGLIDTRLSALAPLLVQEDLADRSAETARLVAIIAAAGILAGFAFCWRCAR